MAHKKAGGSTQLGRDSEAQRLGVKIYGGQMAHPGQIIVRQRGTRYRPGKNVRRASDDTLYAATAGIVRFARRQLRSFTGSLRQTVSVSVEVK